MKARFLSEVDLRIMPEGRWMTLAPILVEADLEGAIGTITVPAHFDSDLASVPRLPGLYLLFGDKGRKAAVVHDWLYNNAQTSREYADEVFLALLEHEEAPWRRTAMWLGVRLGGWMFWKGP